MFLLFVCGPGVCWGGGLSSPFACCLHLIKSIVIYHYIVVCLPQVCSSCSTKFNIPLNPSIQCFPHFLGRRWRNLVTTCSLDAVLYQYPIRRHLSSQWTPGLYSGCWLNQLGEPNFSFVFHILSWLTQSMTVLGTFKAWEPNSAAASPTNRPQPKVITTTFITKLLSCGRLQVVRTKLGPNQTPVLLKVPGREGGMGMCRGHDPLFSGQSALPSLPISHQCAVHMPPFSNFRKKKSVLFGGKFSALQRQISKFLLPRPLIFQG